MWKSSLRSDRKDFISFPSRLQEDSRLPARKDQAVEALVPQEAWKELHCEIFRNITYFIIFLHTWYGKDLETNVFTHI